MKTIKIEFDEVELFVLISALLTHKREYVRNGGFPTYPDKTNRLYIRVSKALNEIRPPNADNAESDAFDIGNHHLQ